MVSMEARIFLVTLVNAYAPYKAITVGEKTDSQGVVEKFFDPQLDSQHSIGAIEPFFHDILGHSVICIAAHYVVVDSVLTVAEKNNIILNVDKMELVKLVLEFTGNTVLLNQYYTQFLTM